MHIKFFTTGGTIDKIYFDDKSEYEVGPPQISEILGVAEAPRFDHRVEAIQVLRPCATGGLRKANSWQPD